MTKPACILIIAGSDSGGGAGIQADIKTVTMLGGYAMTAITAITAQNTRGVEAIHPVPSRMIVQQMASAVEDIGVDAIKIGMLGGVDAITAIAEELRAGIYGDVIVFDPVMVATSGARLADERTIAAMDQLASMSTIVTPNLPELAALCDRDELADDEVEAEAIAYAQRIGAAVLVKGGHADGDMVVDRLVMPDGSITHWTAPRINTTSTHGTGCTLASAIACGLGQGLPLEPAVARARDFVRLALHNAPGLGDGHGPLGHEKVRNEGLFIGPTLNQITLPAKDYDRSVAFYRKLGLTQIVDSQENGYARFEAMNGVTLSIHMGDGVAGGATVYLESGALDAWVAYLARQSVVFDRMPQDEEWGWREARLTDPAGNRLCLYQATEYRRFPPWRI